MIDPKASDLTIKFPPERKEIAATATPVSVVVTDNDIERDEPWPANDRGREIEAANKRGRELAAQAARENRGCPAPPIRDYNEDLKRMLDGIEAATKVRNSGDKDWMRLLRPMPVSYARLDEMRVGAKGRFYVPNNDYLTSDAGLGAEQDAELFASRSHIGDEWTGIAQWQYQVQRLFEPGDFLHLKLIHGTDEWVFKDKNGKEQRKKKTQDVWATYEELIADDTLPQLWEYERQGWNIYICMAVFDPTKIEAVLEANKSLKYDEKLPRRTETNIATVDGAAVVRTVAIDCDADGAASWTAVHDAVLAGTIPAPTIIVQSSESPRKKFQFMWATRGFTLEQQAAVNASLQQLFGGDCKAKDTVRVLRLAGFANQKYEGKPPAIIVESSYAEALHVRSVQDHDGCAILCAERTPASVV